MSTKTKTIKVQRHIDFDATEKSGNRSQPIHCYKVLQITDSLDFHVGNTISEAECRSLCKAKDWKVTVV